MKAKLIRPLVYDEEYPPLPAGTLGIFNTDDADDLTFTPDVRIGHVEYGCRAGKDVRLLDVQPHLWDSHDDVISGCYWADRLLCNDYPKRVYLTHGGQYAIRSLRHPYADMMMPEAAEEDYFTERYDWVVAAMWRPKPRGRFAIGGKWDFVIDADSKYELDDYKMIQTDYEIQHVLTELLALDRIDSYITPEDVTAILYLPEKDSNGDMVDYAEIWITDSSRPYDIQNTYWRVK